MQLGEIVHLADCYNCPTKDPPTKPNRIPMTTVSNLSYNTNRRTHHPKVLTGAGRSGPLGWSGRSRSLQTAPPARSRPPRLQRRLGAPRSSRRAHPSSNVHRGRNRPGTGIGRARKKATKTRRLEGTLPTAKQYHQLGYEDAGTQIDGQISPLRDSSSCSNYQLRASERGKDEK